MRARRIDSSSAARTAGSRPSSESRNAAASTRGSGTSTPSKRSVASRAAAVAPRRHVLDQRGDHGERGVTSTAARGNTPQVRGVSGCEVDSAQHPPSLRAAGAENPRLRGSAAYVADVADVIPVFPLSHVLLPGLPCPCTSSRPRYRQLLDDVCNPAGPGAFGVRGVAPRQRGRGRRSPDIVDVGTVAEIIELDPQPTARPICWPWAAAGSGSANDPRRGALSAGAGGLDPRGRTGRCTRHGAGLPAAVSRTCGRVRASSPAAAARRNCPRREAAHLSLAGHCRSRTADRLAMLGAATTADRLRRRCRSCAARCGCCRPPAASPSPRRVLQLAAHPN